MNEDASERPAYICPHGKHWARCREQACIDEMIAAEEAAYCPHGYLVGCPTCIAALASTGSTKELP